MMFERIGSLADDFIRMNGGSFDPDKRVDIFPADALNEKEDFDPNKRITPERSLAEDLSTVLSGYESYSFDELSQVDNNPVYTELAEKFSPGSWQELLTDEKKTVIGELVNSVSDLLGIERLPAVDYFDGDKHTYGYYSGQDNKLYINEAYLNDPNATLDTVVHEMRHAYQFQHAKNPETHLDRLYALNYYCYIDASHDYVGYRSQLIESEARAFASQFTERFFAGAGGENQ